MPASTLNSFSRKGLRACALILSLGLCFLGNFNLWSVRAEEMSLVHGLYQGSKVANGLASSHLQLGGRYSFNFQAHLHLYGEGELSIKRYSEAGLLTPPNTSDVCLGAGGRYYFQSFTPRFTPYASMGLTLGGQSDAEQLTAGSVRSTKLAGLFYHGSMGLRISLSPRFFLDLESQLFNSSFTSTEKTKLRTLTESGVVETSSSVQKNALYFKSSNSLNEIKFALGLRL